METITGYRFCGFTGYAQFPDSKNKYVYKNINGVRTLLDKKAEENAWRIDGDMSVELYDTKLKQISEFSFFGHSIYPDSNLFFKGLTTILPDTGFITGTEKTAMDIDPDTRANTITDIKKISYDANDTKRYTQNSNTLNDLQFVRQSIAEDNACILASLMSAERGEYIVLIYGYDYEGNLLCADNSTGQRIGTIQITEKAKKILNKSGEIVSISYFDFKIDSETYYVHDGRLKLTSGIGKIINPRIDTISGKLQEQDLVLMTTDGIHYALRPDAMSEIILNSPPEGTEATNALVNAAKNIVKYPDNMSAMLIYMPSGFL